MSTLPGPLLIAMATDLYVIPNWPRDFENPRSETIGRVSYITLPNHFDGKLIGRLKNLPNPHSLHGAFVQIAQVASKCMYRGVLLDHDGPIDAFGLAAKTGFPAKTFQTALEKLSNPNIGLLEKHVIERIDGVWVLPDSVKTWALTCGDRKTRKDTRSNAKPRKDTRGNAKPPIPELGLPSNGGSPLPHEDTRCHTRTREDTESHALPHVSQESPIQNRTEQNRTEVPPTVPQGGQEGIGFEEGKAILNEIFGRKTRKWSFEEDDLLHRAVPIAREDLELAKIWFRLPDDHTVFDKTKRKQELTTYLRDFNGENDKIRRNAVFFRDGLNSSEQKKKPLFWREFFRWKYGDEVRLPENFDELPADQKREWTADHGEFEKDKSL